MLSKRLRLFLLVLTLGSALVLVGCGDDSDDGGDGGAGDGGTEPAAEDAGTESETDDGGDSGDGGDGGVSGPVAAGAVYAGEFGNGQQLTVRLDVEASDPAVVPFEELRALAEVEEPTWIVAEMTSPADLDGTGRFLSFIEEGADPLEDDPLDPDDGISQSTFACSRIEDWFAAAGEAGVDPDELQATFVELHDGECGGQVFQVLAPAGETTTYVMVYDGTIGDFATIEAGFGIELMPA